MGRGLAALMVTYGVIEQGGCVISLLTAVSITHSFSLLSSTPAIRQHRGYDRRKRAVVVEEVEGNTDNPLASVSRVV